MRKKSLVILAAATVVALAGVAVMQERVPAGGGGGLVNGPSATAVKPLLPGLLSAVNTVKRIEIKGPKGAVTLVYRDGKGEDARWTVEERGGYPADLDAVKNLVVGLAEAKAVEPRTTTPELYSRIGVEEPDSPAAASHRVVLKTADGAVVAAVIVGKTANPTAVGAGPRQTYMRRAGEAASWLVESPLDPVEAEATRWLDKKLPRIARDELESVKVTQGDGTLTLKADPADAKKPVAEGLPPGAELSKTTADSAMSALTYLSFEDVAKVDAAWGEKAGLDKAPVYTFTRKGGGMVTVRAVKRDGAYWLALEAKGLEPTPPVNTAGWAYRVYDALGEDLSRPIAEYAKPKEG